MKEPTAEQIKTFWQRWGFREESIERAAMVDCGQTIWVVVYPDGGMTREGYPLLTSDNLFRWAVPEAVKALADAALSSDKEAMFKLFDLWLKTYWEPRPEPIPIALALFWAIWQHIEKAA